MKLNNIINFYFIISKINCFYFNIKELYYQFNSDEILFIN